MKYHVFWIPHVDEKFQAFLDRADDAEELTRSAKEIDRILVKYPLKFGESRYENIRMGFVYPLGVQFEVDQEAHTVFVIGVWRIDRR